MCATNETKFEGKNIYIVETKDDIKTILCDNITISNGLVTIKFPRFVNEECYSDTYLFDKVYIRTKYTYSSYDKKSFYLLDIQVSEPIDCWDTTIKYLTVADGISFNQSNLKLIRTIENQSFDDIYSIDFKCDGLKNIHQTKEEAKEEARKSIEKKNNNIIKYNREFLNGNEDSRRLVMSKYEFEYKELIAKHNDNRFSIFGIHFSPKVEYNPISFTNAELDTVYRKEILDFYKVNNIKY